MAFDRYEAQDASELTLHEWDVVTVVDHDQQGWFKGVIEGGLSKSTAASGAMSEADKGQVVEPRSGWFPASFVEPYGVVVGGGRSTAAHRTASPASAVLASVAEQVTSTSASDVGDGADGPAYPRPAPSPPPGASMARQESARALRAAVLKRAAATTVKAQAAASAGVGSATARSAVSSTQRSNRTNRTTDTTDSLPSFTSSSSSATDAKHGLSVDVTLGSGGRASSDIDAMIRALYPNMPSSPTVFVTGGSGGHAAATVGSSGTAASRLSAARRAAASPRAIGDESFNSTGSGNAVWVVDKVLASDRGLDSGVFASMSPVHRTAPPS